MVCGIQTAKIVSDCEAITAVLMTAPVFWDVMPCQLVNTDVSKVRKAYIFKVSKSEQYPSRTAYLVYGGIWLLRNVGNCLRLDMASHPEGLQCSEWQLLGRIDSVFPNEGNKRCSKT